MKPLDQLAKDVETQVRAVISLQEDDSHAISEINDRLNERFTVRLALDPIPHPSISTPNAAWVFAAILSNAPTACSISVGMDIVRNARLGFGGDRSQVIEKA